MASKKTGRLAGLAALAGAAYLASKGKEGKADKADRDDADRYTGSRASKEDEAAMPDMGEDERPAPTGMSAATKLLAPASAPRPSAAAPAVQRSAPAGSPVLSSGAGSGGPRTIGLGRSSGRGGAEAGEEAAYKAASPRKSGMGSTITNRPDPRAPSIYAGKEAWAKYRAEQSGGKSTVDRQDAGAKRAGLSVDDYYESGKAQIDKQDEKFKRGGAVKKMASGGMTSSASRRADGIATKGKTRGKMC